MTASTLSTALHHRFGEHLSPPELPHLDALAALNERSVCRRYKPDPVPEAVVRLLCATALATPYCFTLSPIQSLPRRGP